MFLLDTNTISELRRKARANPRVLAWANAVPLASLFISAITVLEVEIGIRLLERHDPEQSGRLLGWLEGYVLPAFTDRILPVDLPVARRCAALHVPNPKAERDALIGATALVHGFTVVTRNTADFEAMGVALINPWLPTDNNKGKK